MFGDYFNGLDVLIINMGEYQRKLGVDDAEFCFGQLIELFLLLT